MYYYYYFVFCCFLCLCNVFVYTGFIIGLCTVKLEGSQELCRGGGGGGGGGGCGGGGGGDSGGSVGGGGSGGRRWWRRRCKAIQACNIDAVVIKCCHLDLCH